MKNSLWIIFITSFVILYAGSARSQPSSWRIDVSAETCETTDPKVDHCWSDVWVIELSSGKLYLCEGEMHSGGAPGSQPGVNLVCDNSFTSPISGAIEFSGNAPTVLPPGTTQTAPSQGGNHTYEAFMEYYWVVGSTIDDLRFCFLPIKICSNKPSIVAGSYQAFAARINAPSHDSKQ